jgi:hypothetical protein
MKTIFNIEELLLYVNYFIITLFIYKQQSLLMAQDKAQYVIIDPANLLFHPSSNCSLLLHKYAELCARF